MDRRFLTVVGVSLLFALVVSGIFYQMVVRGKARKSAKVEMRDLVVAAKALPVGQGIKSEDVTIVKVTANEFPKGGFGKLEEVLERPVVSTVLAEEPIREGRLGARGTGVGLAPMIPVGMRAVSVRVNEVVGVAGFVLPGMRVDVLVTGRPPGKEGNITNTILQNILVLSAGQNIEPDARGRAINTPVVTLLVTPEQAETLTLAGNDGRIQLVLRNSGDQGVQKTPGREVAELYGGRAEPPAPKLTAKRAPPPKPAPAAEPPPPPRLTDEVVVIRGNQRTVEVVGIRKPGVGEP
jgi:pilus assembly protein CpaB